MNFPKMKRPVTLPHCHMILWMAEGDRLDTPEQIDSVISARIPDPAENPRLFQLVKDMMCHGPCGRGRRAPCMKDGRCSKHFPKPFCDATRIGDDAYACYKRIPRSAGGNSFVKGGMVFDDSRVVPHSPSQ